MEKDVDFDLARLVVPILSLIALAAVYLKACRDYYVVDYDSPNFYLACLSGFPYFLTFAFSFFAKTENHRKSFYGALGLLAFMTMFEWLGPRSPQMKDIYSVMWFFQTVFVVPFLIYTVRTQSEE